MQHERQQNPKACSVPHPRTATGAVGHIIHAAPPEIPASIVISFLVWDVVGKASFAFNSRRGRVDLHVSVVLTVLCTMGSSSRKKPTGRGYWRIPGPLP